ncbi:DDE-type integrase/transposase/recombinase [Actinomyces israelii]|uniref:DDE-type integrase/transposase/recombinase n=1 Tax=Actinomyces israelii TaxID=1659 RepID=UPI00338ED6F5
MKWVGDITYIRTWEGFVYLATVLDCCTKKAVGYAMADNMRTDSVMRGDRYGGPQVPVHKRRDGIPLGPGVPVHLRAVLPASGEI